MGRRSRLSVDEAAERIAVILLRDVGPNGRMSAAAEQTKRHPAMRPIRIIGVTSPEEWEARRQAMRRDRPDALASGTLETVSASPSEPKPKPRHKRMRCRNCGRLRENQGRGLCGPCYRAVLRAEKRGDNPCRSK